MHHRFPPLPWCQHSRIVGVILAGSLLTLPSARAQVASIVAVKGTSALESARIPVTLLPDAPGFSSSVASEATEPAPFGQIANQKEGSQPSLNPLQRPATPRVPTPIDVVVAPGQVGPHQTVQDKLVGSFRDSVSPFSIGGEIISAGYSHVFNRSPNYGTDAGAFGQRLGASLARGTSQKLFSEGVLASALHEDLRYYQLGSKQNFLKRIFYAGTRPIIGRTDSGRSTINYALIGGSLGASGLEQTYYPARNQADRNVLETWGTGIGGAAIGDEVAEFLPDVLQFVHLKRVSHF